MLDLQNVAWVIIDNSKLKDVNIQNRFYDIQNAISRKEQIKNSNPV